jgi:hypothetical protein
VAVRRFRPELAFEYEIVRPVRARNSSLVADFVEATHAAALTTTISP